MCEEEKIGRNWRVDAKNRDNRADSEEGNDCTEQ